MTLRDDFTKHLIRAYVVECVHCRYTDYFSYAPDISASGVASLFLTFGWTIRYGAPVCPDCSLVEGTTPHSRE